MSEQFPAPELQTREPQHLAVIREHVGFERIPELYDRAYPAIFDALGAAGIGPVAPPMGVVHGEPDDTLDLSVAVPVAEPFIDAGEVRGETLPAGRWATLLIRGDYSLIAPGYESLFGWIADQGFAPSGIAAEQYLTEPEPGGDPSLNETLLAVHLAD